MHFMRLTLLSIVITLFLNCASKKSNFFVHNKDTETIDSLFIYVGDKTYLIEDLAPNTSKGIKVLKMGGKKISLQADNEKSMVSSSVEHPPFRGTLRLIITKKRILSESTFSN